MENDSSKPTVSMERFTSSFYLSFQRSECSNGKIDKNEIRPPWRGRRTGTVFVDLKVKRDGAHKWLPDRYWYALSLHVFYTEILENYSNTVYKNCLLMFAAVQPTLAVTMVYLNVLCWFNGVGFVFVWGGSGSGGKSEAPQISLRDAFIIYLYVLLGFVFLAWTWGNFGTRNATWSAVIRCLPLLMWRLENNIWCSCRKSSA